MNNENTKDLSNYTIKGDKEFTSLFRLNQTTPIYAGVKNGQKHCLWGNVNVELLYEKTDCRLGINIKLNSLGNKNYKVFTNHGSIKVFEGKADGNVYTVELAHLLSEGYTDFMIELADGEGVETFDGGVTFEVDGTRNYDFGAGTSQYLQLYQAVDWSVGSSPMRMGEVDSNMYYLCGLMDLKGLCDKYNLNKCDKENCDCEKCECFIDYVKKFDLKLYGAPSIISAPSQYYGVFVNNGMTLFGTYEVDGAYTVPLLDIYKAGYTEFAIAYLSDGYVELADGFDFDICIGYHEKPKNKKDVRYAYDSEPQKLDIYFPNCGVPLGGYPAVVTVHGGGWSDNLTKYLGNSGEGYTDKKYFGVGGMYEEMHSFILGQGFAHININYRLLDRGMPPNPSKAPYEYMLDDIKSAIDYVENNYPLWINTKKLVLIGYSAGAHLAMLYAYKTGDRRVKLVVSEAGPTDLNNYDEKVGNVYKLKELLGKLIGDANLNIDKLKEASPVAKLNSDSPKTILAYGIDNAYAVEGDGVVPYAHATALQKAYEDVNDKKNCQLFTFNGIQHFKLQVLNLNNQLVNDYRATLIAEFDKIKNKNI